MGFMKLEEGNDAITSPFNTLSNTGDLQQKLNAYALDLPKYHEASPDETLSRVGISPQKRMMSESRLNHLFRDRRGFSRGLSGGIYQYGTFPPWVRFWLLNHMTRKKNDWEMANKY